MRQSGQDPNQVKFRDILLRLRDTKVTKADWERLMNEIRLTLHLPSTSVEDVFEHNVAQLHASDQPVATIKAGAKALADDAGLAAVICLLDLCLLATSWWMLVW